MLDQFIKIARDFAYSEAEKTNMPQQMHTDFVVKKGIELANKLGANIEVVEASMLLMDCLLGQASKEGKVKEHAQMALDKTNELLEKSDLNDDIKENIRHCVLEHHSSDKFYSLESEICCNADCYRFASVKGFAIAFRYIRDMSFSDLITLLGNKFEEKKGALSLSICKDELEPEYLIISEWLNHLRNI